MPKGIEAMFNLVAINLKNRAGELPGLCALPKCGNPARYQFYPPAETGELPDWEGSPICSHHLVEEARHHPEITLSLIDMLIDALDDRGLLNASSSPHGASRIIPMTRR
jgi:hypothetical protein